MGTVVEVVGSGPAAEAILATLDGLDVGVDQQETPGIGSADFAVVVGEAGDQRFGTANEQALDGETPWLAVEIGGVGGYPIVPAAITGFDPSRECYHCLQGRVDANTTPAAEAVGDPEPATERVAGALAGEAAAEFLAEPGEDEDEGSGPSILGHTIELPYRRRRFFPLPGCSCGEGRDTSIDRKHIAVNTEQALERAELGLDGLVGIVQEVGEAESFPAPYYLAQLTDTTGFSEVTAPRQAAGVAAGWDEAFMKALGESYERYAAGVYAESDTTTGTAAELDAAVEPSAFVAPDESEADEETELEWIYAENLVSDDDAMVPAELVFHPPTDAQIRAPLTTGLGLGSSGCEALLSGLYEVIERDAAMLSWYSTFEPLGLTVDDDVFGTLYERATAEGLTVTPLLLTQDVDVPVVAVAVHREEWPSFAIGSNAHLDPEQAALGALEEALQNWMELRSMGPEQAEQASGAIGEYAEMPDQAVELLDYSQTIPAEAAGPDRVYGGEDALQFLIEQLDEAGMRPYATRTTTRDLDVLGFEGVRVLVPDAQPLFLGNPFFGERAETVPEELGFEPAFDQPHHPFP